MYQILALELKLAHNQSNHPKVAYRFSNASSIIKCKSMLQAILKATTSPSISLAPMVKESKGLLGCQKGRMKFHSQQNSTEKKQ